MLDFMVEFYGNMITLCIYVKHEVYTLLLVDMHIGVPGPYTASSWCMYHNNTYIDTKGLLYIRVT